MAEMSGWKCPDVPRSAGDNNIERKA